MLETTVAREELVYQLLPVKWNNSVVLSFNLNGKSGILGVKNNTLFFISYENLDEELILEVPQTLEEIDGLFIIGEWTARRALMTPDIKVQLDGDPFFKDKDVLKTLSNFVKNYVKNIKRLEI